MILTDQFKVMFFLPQLGGGGAEMNAVRLASGLLDAGITPIYVVARGHGSYEYLLPKNVEVIILDTGRINSSRLRLIRSPGMLAQLIDERRPDVLCPVMVSPALSSLSAMRRTRHKPTTILSIQNSLSVSHEQQPELLSRVELQLIRRQFPAFDGAIALSGGVAAELRRIVPALRDKVVVIPNIGMPLPVQIAEAMMLNQPKTGSNCTLLACGRLAKQKDYHTLFQAFTHLSGTNLQLNILGDGDLRQSLMRLTQDLGIADRVAFLGFQQDPFSHMRRADIFVLSSRWEGFGNVLVEAMAMGTPVVSTDCPHGPAEIIKDNQTGLLVPTENPKALAAALQRLIDNPDLRMQLGQAGQKRAQDFSASQISAVYAQHFRSVAAQSQSGLCNEA